MARPPAPRLFGTDGVRGVAGPELTPELALAVASAAVEVLAGPVAGARPLVVVGRDPRPSGEMLEAATVAGLTAAGADVVLVGVLPTPAVAYLAGRYGADLAVMLSASHNPMPDNGIKVFGAGGQKLPDDVERAIEATVAAGRPRRCTGAAVGRVRAGATAATDYLAHLREANPTSLHGLRVVVDCANGAASEVAPEAYRQAGADVVSVAADLTAVINDGVGSTHLEHVARAVQAAGADLGIAHDGDADRCLAVAADGSVVDGDQILAICALALHAEGRLAQATVVATVMSNLGFHHAMHAAGIDVVTAAVGDRYVLAELQARRLSLGGEQSGHIVFTDSATTGDGLLTALRLMAAVVSAGVPLAELAAVVHRLPQVLLNVTVGDRAAVAGSPQVAAAVAAAAAELGGAGRILLRPSGTEPLVRVMVEAPTDTDAARIAARVAAVVARV